MSFFLMETCCSLAKEYYFLGLLELGRPFLLRHSQQKSKQTLSVQLVQHLHQRKMRNEFMAAWNELRSKDSQRILIIGATNRPFDLDDTIIRLSPTRSHYFLCFRLPSTYMSYGFIICG